MAAGTIAPDIDPGPVPAMPPIQGASPAAASSPSQPAAPGAAATPTLGQPAAGGIAQGTGNTKGEIATPPVQLKFDDSKLKQAKTTLDVLNAATASSRKEYMDWWEKTHGDIDDKYDNMKQQLGARPSDDEPQSKKEKFAALLEFGLHLMKNSAQASPNQGGIALSTLSDSTDTMNKAHQDAITNAQSNYDTQASAIETQRDKAKKDADAAMKAATDQSAADSKSVRDQSTALKNINDVDTTKASSLGAPTYAIGPGGVIHSIVRDADGHAHAEPVTGIDGKPFQGKVLGREAGSGIDKSNQDPAAVRTHKYMVNVLGMDPDTAAHIAFRAKTGDPNADHLAVYKSVMAATMDADSAKRTADQYVLDQYGAGGLAKAHAPLVQDAPPAAALKGLDSQHVRDFGAKGKWTLGIDGKPLRVSDKAIAGGAPPQTTQ